MFVVPLVCVLFPVLVVIGVLTISPVAGLIYAIVSPHIIVFPV
jgi:hypothetical protein